MKSDANVTPPNVVPLCRKIIRDSNGRVVRGLLAVMHFQCWYMDFLNSSHLISPMFISYIAMLHFQT